MAPVRNRPSGTTHLPAAGARARGDRVPERGRADRGRRRPRRRTSSPERRDRETPAALMRARMASASAQPRWAACDSNRPSAPPRVSRPGATNSPAPASAPVARKSLRVTRWWRMAAPVAARLPSGEGSEVPHEMAFEALLVDLGMRLQHRTKVVREDAGAVGVAGGEHRPEGDVQDLPGVEVLEQRPDSSASDTCAGSGAPATVAETW